MSEQITIEIKAVREAATRELIQTMKSLCNEYCDAQLNREDADLGMMLQNLRTFLIAYIKEDLTIGPMYFEATDSIAGMKIILYPAATFYE
jgi:hypothetical protein